MLVAVLVADLLFPGSDSLKDKRIRAGFPVSVAEVGFQDLRQRGRIGVALVSTDSRLAQSILDRITDMVGRDGEIEMTGRRIEILRMSDEEE
jgi:uncharacterized protein YlxP (DUF503 family)